MSTLIERMTSAGSEGAMDEWRRVQVPYGASWRQP